jgi:hypothetical protein
MVVSTADPDYLSFKDHLLPVALAKGVGIIGMKLAGPGPLDLGVDAATARGAARGHADAASRDRHDE